MFQELGDAKKTGEADALAINSKDHAEADAYYNDSAAAYAAGEYAKALELAGKASSLYSRLKDAQALSEVRGIYEGSRIKPNAEGNYSKALELASLGDFANASNHARTAFAAYNQLNETELAAKAENLSLSFEKRLEADEYYGKAEELYTEKRFSEASVYLNEAKEIYASLDQEDGLKNVEDLEAKIGDTGTVKKVFVLSGVGLVIIFLIGLILVALFVYLRLSKNEKKDKKSDLNQEDKIK
jgi:tetratricopeptide (TPR) repeat protein